MKCLGSHVQISIIFYLSVIFIFPQNHSIENIAFPFKRTMFFFLMGILDILAEKHGKYIVG